MKHRKSDEDVYCDMQDRLHDALVPYGGSLWQCEYCGHFAGPKGWGTGATRVCPGEGCIGKPEDIQEVTNEGELAELLEISYEDGREDDNPVEDEDFWARTDWARRSR